MSNTNKNTKPTKAISTFLKKGTCSEALFNVLDRAFDAPSGTEEHASAPLAGGVLQQGYQCGMIWGSVLAAGGQAHRLFGPGPKAEAMALVAAQRIVASFRKQNKYINCSEITHLGKSSTAKDLVKFFLLKGGAIGCFRMAKRFSPIALETINAAFSEDNYTIPGQPVSCAAILARKMGATDMQAAMAAGLAGGIGLCGGACGALGAAIWILSLSDSKEPDDKGDPQKSASKDMLDRFLKCTDYTFECSEIVGRRFESVADHAEYLQGGGCAALIDVLAAQ